MPVTSTCTRICGKYLNPKLVRKTIPIEYSQKLNNLCFHNYTLDSKRHVKIILIYIYIYIICSLICLPNLLKTYVSKFIPQKKTKRKKGGKNPRVLSPPHLEAPHPATRRVAELPATAGVAKVRLCMSGVRPQTDLMAGQPTPP